MFIQCSDCNFKYLVNSADLKPNGRMVECANCGNQWFQELNSEEKFQSFDEITAQSNKIVFQENNKSKNQNLNSNVKNLPSTVVEEKKVSILNTSLVLIFLIIVIFGQWILRSNGLNIFVLIYFYIEEFFFNIRLIINDIAKIIYQIINLN